MFIVADELLAFHKIATRVEGWKVGKLKVGKLKG
jgi:hypothetical protein